MLSGRLKYIIKKTKMLVARLVEVLPTVITSSQLCSVKGRSIFDGAAAVAVSSRLSGCKGASRIPGVTGPLSRIRPGEPPLGGQGT
jgi:hypothetical protein